MNLKHTLALLITLVQTLASYGYQPPKQIETTQRTSFSVKLPVIKTAQPQESTKNFNPCPPPTRRKSGATNL